MHATAFRALGFDEFWFFFLWRREADECVPGSDGSFVVDAGDGVVVDAFQDIQEGWGLFSLGIFQEAEDALGESSTESVYGMVMESSRVGIVYDEWSEGLGEIDGFHGDEIPLIWRARMINV